MSNTDITYGAFLVYANGELERECVTVTGGKSCVRALRRVGLVPTVRRHAWYADGTHFNADCGTKNLTVRPVCTAPSSACSVKAASDLRPEFVEVRRETMPDGSSWTLPFAIRVF